VIFVSSPQNIARTAELSILTEIRVFHFEFSCNSFRNILICSKAIVDIRLRLVCDLPSPPSRPIGRITCTQNFPELCLRLPGKLNDLFYCMMLLAIELSLLQRTRYSALSVGKKTPKIAPIPLDFVTLPEDD